MSLVHKAPHRRARSALAVLPLLGLALLAGGALTSAHELYLFATPANSGETTLLQLRIGHAFDGDPVPRLRSSFLSLEHVDASGQRTPVPGAWSAHPVGVLPQADDDPALFVYRSQPIPHRLTAARFTKYLEEEGLSEVLGERRDSGLEESPGRELYSRCSRALLPALSVSEPPPATARANGGCRLELHLHPSEPNRLAANPTGAASSSTLVARLTFDGQPLARRLLRHTQRVADGAQIREVFTDESGRAVLEIEKGSHLLNVVHAVTSDEPDFDWRTFWTSLSFEVGATSARTSEMTSTESRRSTIRGSKR